tara:strand:+ start:3288 stop:3545 length:258 start_codon:yes stop_codon:yes gene_type:complete
MSYFVYLLISTNKKKRISYVGYTNNLEKRLISHNNGTGAKFTRGRKWEIIYSRKYNKKSIAIKEEYKLKKNYVLRNEIKKKFLNK